MQGDNLSLTRHGWACHAARQGHFVGARRRPLRQILIRLPAYKAGGPLESPTATVTATTAVVSALTQP
jgi:hypothetical protein